MDFLGDLENLVEFEEFGEFKKKQGTDDEWEDIDSEDEWEDVK